MAFDLNAAGGYGSGNTDVTADNNTVVNVYAAVSALTSTTITLDDASSFSVGNEIFFHVSLSSYRTRYLGRWAIANITAKNSNVITVDKDLTALADLATCTCQVVSVPHYKNFTVPKDITLSPPAFASGKGGIFILKCAGKFTLNGKINLVDKGISTSAISSRIELDQERYGTLDSDEYAGWENAATQYHFALNVGDGAAFILANQMEFATSARIGNPDIWGVQFCRGASDSINRRDGTTNIGGSTIMLIADSLSGAYKNAIAKYRDSSKTEGLGLCRCYIASNTRLANDEGLYSYDFISDGTRLKKNCNVKDFGSGAKGNLTNQANVNAVLNVYARVSDISGKVITYADKSKSGNFNQGDLVMIHYSQKSASDNALAGRFWLSTVDADDGFRITLHDTPPIGNAYLDKYSAQIVWIPQFNKFTLSTTHNKTPKFDGAKGGIFAIAVKDTCDLNYGVINVEGKGGAPAYGKVGMTIGNSHNNTRLPIGEGHGSVFILAKSLLINSNTRIGATYSGTVASGYRGKDGKDLPSPVQNKTASQEHSGTGGSPSGAGSNSNSLAGGYGSNSAVVQGHTGLQGAHIFIVADSIVGLNIAAISTGGQAYQTTYAGADGGAGYGAGGVTDNAIVQENNAGLWGNYVAVGGQGGYIAGGGGGYDETGGGGSGTAFIYCNNSIAQDPDYIIPDMP